MTHRPRPLLLVLLPLAVGSACASLEYDLSGVPIPVSAKPADAIQSTEAEVVPFELETKNVLWVHGLFGHEPPDVAARVAEVSQGYDRITDFRVAQGAGFHDWLATHLSLTLVRMKNVTIRGRLVRDPE